MSLKIEFHFDFGSPNAYLSHLVIPEIEQRTGSTFRYVPVLLGGVFKLTNNASPAVTLQGIKNKGEYGNIEMQRYIKKHGITSFQFNPHFPVNTLQIMRGAVFADQQGYLAQYVDAVYRNMWSEQKKMDDPDVIKSALTDAGLPVDEILAGIQQPEVKQKLISNTEMSVERGAFGSPTFFVNDEIFFGKDKLRDVEDEIVAQG